MARWTIPEPIPIDWPMRDLSTAKVTVRDLEEDGGSGSSSTLRFRV